MFQKQTIIDTIFHINQNIEVKESCKLRVLLKRGASCLLIIAVLFSLFSFNLGQSYAEPSSDIMTEVNALDNRLLSELDSFIDAEEFTKEEALALVDSGEIEKDIIEQLSEGEGDVEFLGQQKVIYSLNTQTGDVIELAEESTQGLNKNINNELKQKASSFPAKLTFAVTFNYLIANPGTTTAKFVMYGTVTNIAGIGKKPTNYTITLRSEVATSKNGSYSGFKSTNKKVKLKENVVLESAVSKTYYWRGIGGAFANYPDASYRVDDKKSDVFLLNRKGVRYPLGYSDPQSGIKLWEPPTTLVQNPREAGSKYRSDFMTYYEKNWGKPTKFSWSNVQIHHMKPLKYGGSDATSNLIPLWKPGSTAKNKLINHSVLTTWWQNY